MGARLVSYYARLSSENYLKGIFGPLFKQVFEDSKKYEVNISKLPNGTEKQIAENQKNLSIMANKFLDVIFSSSNSVPFHIRRVCGQFETLVEKKFKGFGPIAIGGIFFLRLVCPAIVAPATYNILEGRSTNSTPFSKSYLKLLRTSSRG